MTLAHSVVVWSDDHAGGLLPNPAAPEQIILWAIVAVVLVAVVIARLRRQSEPETSE